MDILSPVLRRRGKDLGKSANPVHTLTRQPPGAPRQEQFAILENTPRRRLATKTVGAHSSGTPALRKPAKKVASNKARTFGTPQYPGPPTVPPALSRAMLE